MDFRAVLIGDVVGKPGRKALAVALRRPPEGRRPIDVVIVNAENAAGGSGFTPAIFEELRALGVDVRHAGRPRLPQEGSRARSWPSPTASFAPPTFQPEAVGRGYTVLESQSGFPFAVVSLLGRTFMKPADCPFHAVDEILAEIGDRAKLIFLDMHAEATSDKIAMGWHLDGRATCVFGTHTHVQTADERGPARRDRLHLGPRDDRPVRRRPRAAKGEGPPGPYDRDADVFRRGLRRPPRLRALVTADTATGRATAIERLNIPVTDAQLAAKDAAPAEGPAEPTPEVGETLEESVRRRQ